MITKVETISDVILLKWDKVRCTLSWEIYPHNTYCRLDFKIREDILSNNVVNKLLTKLKQELVDRNIAFNNVTFTINSIRVFFGYTIVSLFDVVSPDIRYAQYNLHHLRDVTITLPRISKETTSSILNESYRMHEIFRLFQKGKCHSIDYTLSHKYHTRVIYTKDPVTKIHRNICFLTIKIDYLSDESRYILVKEELESLFSEYNIEVVIEKCF